MFVRVDVDYGISQGTNPPFHPAQGLELELPRHATAKCARVSKGHSDTPTLRGSSRAQTPPGAPLSRSSALRTPSFFRASARSRFNATRRIVGLALVCFFASGVAWPAQAQLSDPALTDVTANPASDRAGREFDPELEPARGRGKGAHQRRRIDRGAGHGHLARRHAERDDHLRAGGHGRRRGAGHVRAHRDRAAGLGRRSGAHRRDGEPGERSSWARVRP